MPRTMVQGQLYSDAGIEKFSRLWCENLLKINRAKFQQDPEIYLLEAWADLPWGNADREAVIRFIARDEYCRHLLHAFDVLYCEPRIVCWDTVTRERFSYVYSIEQDFLVHSTTFVLYEHADDSQRCEYMMDWDPRKDKKYG